MEIASWRAGGSSGSSMTNTPPARRTPWMAMRTSRPLGIRRPTARPGSSPDASNQAASRSARPSSSAALRVAPRCSATIRSGWARRRSRICSCTVRSCTRGAGSGSEPSELGTFGVVDDGLMADPFVGPVDDRRRRRRRSGSGSATRRRRCRATRSGRAPIGARRRRDRRFPSSRTPGSAARGWDRRGPSASTRSPSACRRSRRTGRSAR